MCPNLQEIFVNPGNSGILQLSARIMRVLNFRGRKVITVCFCGFRLVAVGIRKRGDMPVCLGLASLFMC